MRASSIDSRFFGLEGSGGGRVEPRFGCARASLSLIVVAAACLRDAYPIKIARTRGVTRVSRELRAFREANEPPKKKALSADDRFTNVTNIWKFLVARKKRKKRKAKRNRVGEIFEMV